VTDLPAAIGRYEIRRELGRGMMGVVYAAHDPSLGRDIALKVIQSALAVGPEERLHFEQRFFAEARTAARLSHPGIVVIHDVGRDPASGAVFMALELLTGETVADMLKERATFAWQAALRIVQRVAEALDHAHSLGVVHRDIKPANLMLLSSGVPKIMDFGIAKLDTSQLTATGQLLGTPLYMSPEQALAQPVDGRSDLFSLGSVLYEMLTGRRAFAGESVTKILFQLVSLQPDAPSRLDPGLPEELDYVIARCLAKDVSHRYPDARTLAEDTEDILAGRSPRWRANWQLAPPATGTMVAPAPQLPSTDQYSFAPSVAVQPRGVAVPGTASRPARPAAAAQDSRVSLWSKPWLWAAGTFILLLGAWWALRGSQPRPVARLVVPQSSAAGVEPEAASDRSEAVPTSDASPATQPAIGGPIDGSRVLLDFEHSLKSGRLRVWVDDQPVIDEAFGGRIIRKFGGLELRKGHLSDELEVAPGRREMRVEVSWEDNVKTETISADFKAGSTLRLKARFGGMGGLRKDLSLEWN
jgi:hypothetical protein